MVAADGTGRALTRAWEGQDGAVGTSSAGPFPGAFYVLPVLAGLVVLAALVGLALHLVVSRPAVAAADPATDTALRRAGAHRVLRGAASGAGLTLAGLLLTAGSATRGVADGAAGLGAARRRRWLSRAGWPGWWACSCSPSRPRGCRHPHPRRCRVPAVPA